MAMQRRQHHPCDPAGLIREAYNIEGIAAEECRSIFFEWVLGLKDGRTAAAGAATLLADYRDAPADHPMTALLREARDRPEPRPRRSGGAMGRRN